MYVVHIWNSCVKRKIDLNDAGPCFQFHSNGKRGSDLHFRQAIYQTKQVLKEGNADESSNLSDLTLLHPISSKT